VLSDLRQGAFYHGVELVTSGTDDALRDMVNQAIEFDAGPTVITVPKV